MAGGDGTRDRASRAITEVGRGMPWAGTRRNDHLWPRDRLTMKPRLQLYEGYPAGRDPRRMTQGGHPEAGHERMSLLYALRAHCLDCCGQQTNEVAACSAVECPSWPFRMGTNPWRRPASEARRQAARQAMAQINRRRQKSGCSSPRG